MKIIVVENNDLMRKEISKTVQQKDDIVLECSNAETALEKCVEFGPDWFLLDIQMRKMNGLVAAEKIKKLMPKANIAFVTSYDLNVYQTAAARLGIKHYFLKNNLLEIRDLLKNWREKRK